MVPSTSLNLSLLVAFVIGSFATFRIAKLITQDVIFNSPRLWLIAKLVVSEKTGIRKNGFRVKVAYLLGCPICCGVWLSLAFACILTTCWPWDLGVIGWTLWASIAGAQVTLQAIAPGKPTKGLE
jgi:hypothetical protein